MLGRAQQVRPSGRGRPHRAASACLALLLRAHSCTAPRPFITLNVWQTGMGGVRSTIAAHIFVSQDAKFGTHVVSHRDVGPDLWVDSPLAVQGAVTRTC